MSNRVKVLEGLTVQGEHGTVWLNWGSNCRPLDPVSARALASALNSMAARAESREGWWWIHWNGRAEAVRVVKMDSKDGPYEVLWMNCYDDYMHVDDMPVDCWLSRIEPPSV